MARILCNVAGGGKPLKGNAEAGDVLAGKTFSNKQSNALTGTMPNNGAWSSTTSGAGTVTIPAGYHNGSGSVDCSGAYNAGIAAADARVNTYSASYNSGYTNGNSAGVSSGKSQFNRTYTIKATWKAWSDTDGDQRADVTGSVLVHFNPYTGSIWADTATLDRWHVLYYVPGNQGVYNPVHFDASASLQ